MLASYYSTALLLPSVLALTHLKVPQAGDEASLLQRSSATSQGGAKEPQPPNFFDEFDQGESTIDEAFYANVDFPAHLENSALISGDSPGVDEKFFVETPSAGEHEAWQTYPGLNDVPANRQAHEGTWLHGEKGFWQKYSGSEFGFGASSNTANDASWVDGMTENYNGLGESQLPPPTDAKRLLDVLPNQSWVQRAVNTTLTCQGAGCTALSQLNVFNAETEEVQYCRLNIDVHPTDYDNALSREHIKFFKVNNHMASGQCQVHQLMGCNASAWRPLVPCLQDLPVDHLLSNGKLVIEGQINNMVDECPFEGNLLSGVAMVTCMARDKVKFKGRKAAKVAGAWADGGAGSGSGLNRLSSTSVGNASDKPNRTAPPLYEDLLPGSTHSYEARLQCGSPGCTARTLMNIDTQVLRAGAICMMSISVVQTDFDESVQNDTERIEFIRVEGLGNVSSNVKPGRNPCTEAYSSGTPVSLLDTVYQVVESVNVTDAVRQQPFGRLVLDGKISLQVDDCGSNDNLLDGKVMVECKIPH